ncbi:TPA: hypothetical protein ACMDRZ_003807 [Vibrio cholerae]|uniref:hypothetical protein n=1 Tax=Vibrio cholerae TaxID=666 RepID=UPI0028525168|nr:hypothetical protein [Vibrio cholerae]UGK72871.1 hypothetical protein HPY17_020445 [Vibrio cholerae]UGK72877.1 hypothetical protein HPY10_020090 [Vibrio cholerae]
MAKHDHDTLYAVKSILLGARIHDASVLCDKTDQAMRWALFQYCQDANPVAFEQISIEAAHKGYTTVPVQMLRDSSSDFIGELDNEFITGFMAAQIDDMSDVETYVKRCLFQAQKRLSIWRARHDSWSGLKRMMEAS